MSQGNNITAIKHFESASFDFNAEYILCFNYPHVFNPHIVHEPGPQKGGHWYYKKVQIIILIFDKVYVCTTYFCIIALCM